MWVLRSSVAMFNFQCLHRTITITSRLKSNKFTTKIPFRDEYDRDKCDLRRKWVEEFTGTDLSSLGGWWGPNVGNDTQILRGHIEAPIGMARIPIGIAGPLLFNGTNAKGEIFAPIAATEGTLVAAITRGASALNKSGGVQTHAGAQRVGRAPLFETESPVQASVLAEWLSQPSLPARIQVEVIKGLSRNAQLKQILPVTDMKSVHAIFLYSCGDAAGQNMTTKVTDAAVKWVKAISAKELPTQNCKIVYSWIEGNMSGDKKSTYTNFLLSRGTCATAEAVIPESVVKTVFKIDLETFLSHSFYCHKASERTGIQGHNINVSNVLAGIFTATGQDIASIHESCLAHLHISKVEQEKENGMLCQLQLPSLMVGTVGGGTTLPTQKDCLKIVGCLGEGKRGRLAEIIAGYSLALDLSTLSAVAANQFAAAHKRLGRKHSN